ncbi:hypothetical protein ACFSX9_14920 [Flavobacterium ardleyense]|uniref:YD repeat-containing protein n=1 Tax=Flavobacterium ardleyense TaxID=2038737 RepID=A0ABW5ZCQ9_9FLAO
MKKLLYLFSAVALTLTSCSSDDSSDPTTTEGTTLKKIIETYSDGSIETTNFFYNGNKIIKQTTDYGDEVQYTYTGDLITKERYLFEDGDSGDILEEIITYEYDTNNRLIKSTRTDEDNYVEVDVFTYNANGTTSFVTTADGNTIATGTIHYVGNQPYKKEIIQNEGDEFESTTTEVSTFDTKRSPYSNITGFSKTIIASPYTSRGYPGIVNNPLLLTVNGISQESSSYTYNASNMPATETVIYFGSTDENSTSEYFYN